MRLIFARYVGEFFNGERMYELIFSENPNKTTEEGALNHFWDDEPCNGKPTCPQEFADRVEFFTLNDPELELLIDSHSFSMEQAINGVVSLIWSNSKILDEYFTLFWGQTYEQVQNKLYSLNIKLFSKKAIA
jgi:hypothetical protein